MHGSIKVLLVTSIAVATAAFGAVPASATAQRYPQIREWEPYDETAVFPNKTACADEVSAREVGAVRVTVLSKKRRFVEFDDTSKVTFTNTRTKATWTIGEGGDGYLRSLKGDYDKIAIAAEGENWAQGKGLYGIPWSRGDISIVETKVNNPKKATFTKYDLTHAETFIQVCYQIGTTPVRGKNVVPEAAAVMMRKATGLRRS